MSLLDAHQAGVLYAQVRMPRWVADRLANLPPDFTGHVELNFFRGGISTVTIKETVKPNST